MSSIRPDQARNQAMRDRVDDLLGDLRRRTEALKDAQQQAITVVGSATSRDGSVSVTVNAAGVVTGVELAPSTFDRTTPDSLARTITDLARAAASDARAQTDRVFAPLQEGIPDLCEIVPGAPSIRDLRPAGPADPPARRGDDFSDDPILRVDR